MSHETAFALIVALLYDVATILCLMACVAVWQAVTDAIHERDQHGCFAAVLFMTSGSLFYLLSLVS